MKREPHVCDNAYARLHAAGWSVGETAAGGAWIVTGVNGENVIRARGRTQAEAWRNAVCQAESIGMVGRAFY